MESLIQIVDNANTLVWCVQATELKSVNKVNWKIYVYRVTLDLYSASSGYAKNDSENWI